MNNQTKWPHIICNYYQSIFILFVMVLLSGCGGSSGSNDIDNPTIGANIRVQMTDGNGQGISTAEAGSAIIVRVTATNDFGNPASGVTVTFATDRGTLSQDNALTNSSGVAQANLLTTNSQIGVAVVTATATIDGTELSRTGQIELTEATITTPNIVTTIFDQSCTNQITAIEAGQTVCVTASVFNGTVPITNQVVEFSATQGIPTPASNLTNDSGVATIAITSTTDLLGASTVSATADIDGTTYTGSNNFQYSAFIPDDTPDPEITLTLRDSNCVAASNTAQSSESICVSVNLTQDQQPLNDKIVELTAPVGTLRQTSGLTDANGNFVTYIDSGERETGASTITVTYNNNFSDSQNYQFVPFTTNTSTLSLTILDSNCSVEQNTITAGSSLCFQASLISNNQPVSNAIVSYEAPLGSLRQLTSLTNSAGVATAIIDSTDTTIGAAIASVTHDGITETANYQFTESPSTNTTELTLTIRDSQCQNLTNETDAGSSLCLIASLQQNGQPLSGQLLSFTAPLGSLEPESVLTDANGNGQVKLNSIEDNLGAGTATVTYNEFTKAANYEFIRGQQIQPTALNLVIKNEQCEVNLNIAAQGEILCIQAQLTAENGGVKDAIIEFSAPIGTLVPNTALTNEFGIAEVKLDTTNAQLGAAEVLATNSTLTGRANYEVIDAGNNRELSLQTYEQNCLTSQNSFSAGTAFCLSATLVEISGQTTTPIENEIITFETPMGALRQLTALTNANGIATAVANSATTELGAATATATTSNLVAQANFELTAQDAQNSTTPNVLLVTVDNNGPTSGFSVGETAHLEATLTNANDQPIRGEIIRYTIERGTLETTSALTDQDGVAQVEIFTTNDDIGAGVATASVEIEGVTYTGSYNYEVREAGAVGLASAQIGYIDDTGEFIQGQIGVSITDSNDNGVPDLSAGGTMGLTVAIVDQDKNRILTPVPVTFTSSCASNGTANIDEQAVTINGEARATYQDLTCATTIGNQDTIVASITVNTVVLSATVEIELLPDDVGSIEFISAEPDSIVLQGTGGQGKQETSTLTYLVKSLLGNPVAQQRVNFALDTTVGGLSINPTESFTNSQGLVTTRVTAGNVPAAVRVSATTELSTGAAISTQSDLLSVNTGLPDQNSITLSTATLNPEAHNLTGQEVQIFAYMADTFNNPVPDGTTINFTTEGGFIQPTCNTVNGQCSVTWTGTNPRVSDHRITVLATAIGHETFFDVNGNNVFDDPDTPNGVSDIHDQSVSSGLVRSRYEDAGFVDLSEAWRDDDEDLTRDTGEIFIDYNNDNTFNNADRLFNGPHCIHTSLCGSSNARKINIRKALIMVMSGTEAKYTLMTDAITGTDNTDKPHIGTRYVLSTNDNDTDDNDPDVQVNGGVSIDSNSVVTPTAESRITLEEGQSLSMTLAIADQAEGFGETLPAETAINITTSFGSITGNGSFSVPNQTGYPRKLYDENGTLIGQYGGNLMSFSLINTNSTSSTGDTTQSGLITITVLFTASNTTQIFTMPFTMIGR